MDSFSIPWWPAWIWSRTKYILTKIKIPLFCYVWFKKIKEKSIKFNDAILFNLTKKNFENIPYNQLNKQTIKFIEALLDFLGNNNVNYWLEVSVLSEIWRWHSFGFSWTFCSILVTWLFILSWKLDSTYLESNYDEFIKSETFKEIEIFARELEHIIKNWNTIWQNVLTTLNNNFWPSYYYCNDFEWEIPFEEVKHLSYKYIVIWNDFFRDKDPVFDYYMIYSWVSSMILGYTKFSPDQLYAKFEKYKSIISEEILKWDDSVYIKKFIWKEPIYKHFIDIISLLWIKTIEYFKLFKEQAYDENIVDDFIEHLNNNRYALSILDRQNSFADDFIFSFKKNIRNSNEKIWIIPAYSWKLWWGYLVTTKPWISRDTLKKTIKDMKSSYPNIEIEYCSFEDWFIGAWIELEQYISEWIFSDYVQKDKVLYKDSNWISYIWNYEDILKKENKWILLDTITKRIYFKWQKLTSKEISSQNATIDILDILLENLWKDVSSKVFSSSSYSKNRNEMFSKIIFPLSKVVSDWGFKDFNFKSSWWITEFFVRLDKPDVSIGIIRRI